jgi:lipoate-protein ligase A
MAADEALLESVQRLGRPVLRLYGWNVPAASFGYFQKYSDVSAWTTLRPLVRRPTGGGLVPHDADWTYSLVFPPGHPWFELRAEESYRRAHDWIADSLQSMKIQSTLAPAALKDAPGQCFIGAEKFDVIAGGRKIAGAAQKRNKFGLLLQGSIQPSPQWQRAEWEEALLRSGTQKFGAEWFGFELSDEIKKRAEELVRIKYGAAEYNERR